VPYGHPAFAFAFAFAIFGNEIRNATEYGIMEIRRNVAAHTL
jgi:hypothetical protein